MHKKRVYLPLCHQQTKKEKRNSNTNERGLNHVYAKKNLHFLMDTHYRSSFSVVPLWFFLLVSLGRQQKMGKKTSGTEEDENRNEVVFPVCSLTLCHYQYVVSLYSRMNLQRHHRIEVHNRFGLLLFCARLNVQFIPSSHCVRVK
jgi:hypothetical protein